MIKKKGVIITSIVIILIIGVVFYTQFYQYRPNKMGEDFVDYDYTEEFQDHNDSFTPLEKVDDEYPECVALGTKNVDECNNYYYWVRDEKGSQEEFMQRCNFESALILTLFSEETNHCSNITNLELSQLCNAINEKNCDSLTANKESCNAILNNDINLCPNSKEDKINVLDCKYIVSFLNALSNDCSSEEPGTALTCQSLVNQDTTVCDNID